MKNCKKPERYGAIGGMLFVLLDGAAAVAGGDPPAINAVSAADYFANNSAGLQAGLWLFGLSTIALTWWFGSLWTLMVRADDAGQMFAVLSMAGLVVGGALSLVSTVLMAAASLRPEAIGEHAEFVYVLGSILLAASGFGLAAHIAATIVFSSLTGVLSRWLVVLGALAAVCFCLSAVLASISTGAAASNLGLVAFVLWCVWILGISYRVWNDNSATTQPQRI